MAKVLQHPRCVNCHTPDESPRQGDAHVLHDPPVVRGSANRGVVGMQCTTCHQDRNAEPARIPGAPDWHLAPVEMVWLDRTAAQICEQIKDPGAMAARRSQRSRITSRTIRWSVGLDPGGIASPRPARRPSSEPIAAWIDTGAACPDVESSRDEAHRHVHTHADSTAIRTCRCCGCCATRSASPARSTAAACAVRRLHGPPRRPAAPLLRDAGQPAGHRR